MLIGVKEASELLSVSEKTIYRWVADGRIPFSRVGRMYRFSRSELTAWASGSQREPVVGAQCSGSGESVPSVSGALARGGIYYRVGGETPEQVIGEIISIMRLPDGLDREHLREATIEREVLASTGVGAGVALPHPRHPLAGIPQPFLTLAFPEKPLDWGAVDGQEVGAIFLLCSPDIRSHLTMLSCLSSLFRTPAWEQIREHAPVREEIMERIGHVEKTFRQCAS